MVLKLGFVIVGGAWTDGWDGIRWDVSKDSKIRSDVGPGEVSQFLVFSGNRPGGRPCVFIQDEIMIEFSLDVGSAQDLAETK
jgi:hypothetical protein